MKILISLSFFCLFYCVDFVILFYNMLSIQTNTVQKHREIEAKVILFYKVLINSQVAQIPTIYIYKNKRKNLVRHYSNRDLCAPMERLDTLYLTLRIKKSHGNK